MLKTALFDCAINEKCCSVDRGRGICPLFSSPPLGIWQLKSPHPREFAIQGKKNANARGGGAGRRWNWLMHYHIATCFNALWNIPKTVFKSGSRINTDRFLKRSPKVQASNIRGSEGMLPWQFFEFLSPLSWVSESFRQAIGQFHSTRMKPCKSANYFILDFNLKSFCGQQEEPAILISRLLLCMHPMYVASICLDFQ